MIDKHKYGVVYTPDRLADFVAKLLLNEFDITKRVTVLDPSCGEGALLNSVFRVLGEEADYVGIDIDSMTIQNNRANFNNQICFIEKDFIIPNTDEESLTYWKKALKQVDLIIANPPWSTEKIYERKSLIDAGYTCVNGQYDNYILFIELCIKLLSPNGACAFILPDSLFSSESKEIRKLLCETTGIKVVARLGEKLFKNVNRAVSVIIVKKESGKNNRTKCFRLETENRKKFLNHSKELFDCYMESVHEVKQARFSTDKEYLFGVDMTEDDEYLVKKIEKDKIDWKSIFSFGRGVEISKTGEVILCEKCQRAQGYTKKQLEQGSKKCSFCDNLISVTKERAFSIISDKETENAEKILVGENLHRYAISGNRYIKLNVSGINYKNPELYVPPKILVRKTGLGIDACIDYDSTYISQTIYSCQYLKEENPVPIEYYLALLNSRVIYYYYIKEFGENEWKSHPYMTKDIVFKLPLKKYSDNKLSGDIVQLTKRLLLEYNRTTDLTLEKKIMQLYELLPSEIEKIRNTICNMPDLSAINNMKF